MRRRTLLLAAAALVACRDAAGVPPPAPSADTVTKPRMIETVEKPILEVAAPAADLRVRYGDGPSQFADLYRPNGDGPFPTVVLIHGGFWRSTYDLSHMAHLAEALRQRGIAAWSLEYRRVGEEGGGYPNTLLDVAIGADSVRGVAARHGLDPGRVIAMGFSAGGHLALWLAARHRIPVGDPLHDAAPLLLRGAISLAGVSDLRRAAELGLSSGVVDQLLGGEPDAVPHRLATASPYELLPLGIPQLLVHGTDDANVPIELSRRYVERARNYGDPAELFEMPDTGHFELIDPRLLQGLAVLDRAARMLGPLSS